MRLRRWCRVAGAALVAVMGAPVVPGASGPWTTVVQAQVVERQVPFDADGRLLVLTPTLVTRLGLGAPDWPVPPGFDEAKLYVSGDSAFVLVVRRGDRNERYPLTVEQRDALGRRIAAAAAASGMPTQEVGTSGLEESARGQFVRTQSGLGVLWYGTWAVLATERLEAWAVTSAAAFFASQAIARSTEVTVPMASMASDLALRAGAATLLVSPDALHPQALGAAALATSLVGAVAGFQAGRSLTAAEAEATGWGSSTLAIAVAGLAASADWGERATRGATAAALVAGLPLGLQYPRRAPYVLTAGDLYAMRVPQAIGAGAGLSLALALDASDRSLILGATLGYLGGVALGDRLIAKPYDFALWQAVLLGTGASVSAFAASALLSSGPQDGAGYAAILTGAAALGAFASAALMDLTPGRVAGRQVGDASGRPARVARPAPGSRGRPSFRLDPMAALTAAAKAPGRHAIVTLTF